MSEYLNKATDFFKTSSEGLISNAKGGSWVSIIILIVVGVILLYLAIFYGMRMIRNFNRYRRGSPFLVDDTRDARKRMVVIQDPNKQGKSGSDQQLYINLKKYFQDLFNFKGQVSNSTYGQGGSSNPTKQYTGGQKVTQKITQPPPQASALQ
jgi:hypothetical protein